MELDVVAVRLIKDNTMKNMFDEIEKTSDAATILYEFLADLDREVIAMLTLNTTGRPINISVVSVGTLDHAIVHPREVFKGAILSNASKIILAHNHPSGDVLPSKHDAELTSRLIEVGKIIGIDVIDHIIIADSGQYFSFSENEFNQKGNYIGTVKKGHIIDDNKNIDVWQKVFDRQVVKKREKVNKTLCNER